MVNTYLPGDPLLNSQWHLSMIGRLGFTNLNNTAGLERIWANYTGNDVSVGIWDDGLQLTHWDLSANYDASSQVTVEGTLNDGQPLTSNDGHGTSVAGLIAAADNGLGGVGVAFDASLTCIRIFGGPDDINNHWSRYIQSLNSLGNFDVTNHSYGGTPNFDNWGDVAKFETAAISGRGGLGTINVKSAGNSNIDGGGDALDASRFTVTIAALDTTGQVTSYSSYGSHILVSAPAGAVTTDLQGSAAGYNGLLGDDYTNSFGGTSAAGPITAGIITLMLAANPELGWRDVQNILCYSAVGTGSLYTDIRTNENFSWQWTSAENWNGGGLHYSEDYGYGMVNAYNAVRMSEVWSLFYPEAATSANEAVASSGTIQVNKTISDLTTLNYSFVVSQNISMEHISLTISFTHSYFTDLRLHLVSPDGTSISLYDGSTGNSKTSDYGFTYTFDIDGLLGEFSAGTWTLQIEDVVRGDSGVLTSIAFKGYGSAVATGDVYHYTDEVLTVLAQSGQADRLRLVDIDGGVDWINGAAMYRDLVLDLNEGMTSTLAGSVFLVIASGSQIENVVGGDGCDRLVGNSLNNVMYGMRGDDSLCGGSGIDTAGFAGDSGDYEIVSIDSITIVKDLSGRFGTDILSDFEFLAFDDKIIVLQPTDNIPSDTKAPELQATTPQDDATEVAMDAILALTFDEAVLAGTGDIVISTLNGKEWCRINVQDSTQVQFSGNTVTINPATDFSAGTSYSVVISSGAITDTACNAFSGLLTQDEFTFKTIVPADTKAPELHATTPQDDATEVAMDAILTLTFDEAVMVGTGNIVISTLDGKEWLRINVQDSTQVQFSGNTVTINPATDFSAGTSYSVVISFGSITDTACNAFSGIVAQDGFTFTTVPRFTVITGTSSGDALTGTADNDHIIAQAGNDRLTGNAGNDVLDGGLGNDTMHGGAGNDTYVADSLRDKISESTNSGIDTVVTSLASFTIGSNVENLEYSGTVGFLGSGNSLDNVVTGGMVLIPESSC